jgi:hypothetical protein
VKGKWFAYHRKTGIRIKAEYGTGEFFAELAALERKLKTAEALPGTLGLLFTAYRASSLFADLAPATRIGYNLDTVRRWLGQKTLAMAIHYSETADTTKQMRGVLKKFDPLGSKSKNQPWLATVWRRSVGDRS